MFKLKPSASPFILTALGAVPFLAAALAMLINKNNPVMINAAGLWLNVYAAVILSFLGGVRWGVEIVAHETPRAAVLILAIIGALVGWTNVLFYFQFASGWGFLVLAAAFLGYFMTDRGSRDMPVWYRSLRIWPSAVAIGCLLVGFGLLELL